MTIGYIYKPLDKLGMFENALAGQTISNPDREPPWIIVNHSIDDSHIAKWPGRLWRAEVVDALEPQEHRGKYTRCIAVKIIEEVKTEILFGDNGAKIEEIMEYASTLNLARAEQIERLNNSGADSIETAGWHRWLAKTGAPKSDPSIDMSGVVAAGNNRKRSPIGHGLSLVHRCVSDTAKKVMGDAAFEEDEDGIWLLPPWSVASNVLCAAAWGLGVPELFNDKEIETLLEGWKTRPQRNGDET